MYHGDLEMNIAVFVFAYPVLSETFVLNELFQLQEMGVSGSIWREKSGNGAAHPKVELLRFPVHDCPEKIMGSSSGHIIKDHCWWLARYPLRYFRLLTEVIQLFPDAESLKIFVKAVSPARKVLQSGGELVYVHESDRAFVFGLCAARLCNLPLVIIFHTYYLFVKKAYVGSKVLAADGVIFQSEYSKNVVAKRLGLTPAAQKKLVTISSPGIDTDMFTPTSTSSPIKKADSTSLRLLSVGRLEEAKGYEYLIQAVKILKDTGVALECRIVGEGSYRARLEALRKSFGLEKEVTLLGALPHGKLLQHEYQQADIFILPSIQDTEGVHDVHPNVVKEAMSSGLIVITTKLGGIDEVINNEVDGLLIEAATPEMIANSVMKVLQLSLQKQSQLRSLAREKIQKKYDANSITSMLVKTFKKYV